MSATGNINEDFFEQNSELTLLSEAKKLIASETKQTASKIMWAVYLLEDPNSRFYRMPREERIAEIKRDYYDLNIEKYKPLIEQYVKTALTKEEILFKQYADMVDKLMARASKLNMETDAGLKTAVSILDKLPKIWDGFHKVKQQMKEEGSKTQIKGNAKEGSREKRRRGSGRTGL